MCQSYNSIVYVIKCVIFSFTFINNVSFFKDFVDVDTIEFQ